MKLPNNVHNVQFTDPSTSPVCTSSASASQGFTTPNKYEMATFPASSYPTPTPEPYYDKSIHTTVAWGHQCLAIIALTWPPLMQITTLPLWGERLPAYLVNFTFLFPFMGPAKIPNRNNFTSSTPLLPVPRFHYLSFIHSLPANFDSFISGTLMLELPGLSSLSRKLSLIKNFYFLILLCVFLVPLCFHQSRTG